MSLSGTRVFGLAGGYSIPATFKNALRGGGVLLVVVVFLSAFAGLLYKLYITSLFGGYLFSFALLGLWWPTRLLEAFVFFDALGHRDFTYVVMSLGGPASDAKIFITEWVLTILLIAAIPGLWRLLKRFDRGVVLVAVYFAMGSAVFAMTFQNWPPADALRDFALVYYSLFASAVMVHIHDYYGVRRIAISLVLGTLPNLMGEIGNYLYGTLPLTPDQKNASMRNSFFYMASLGFLLPHVVEKGGKLKVPTAAYCISVYMIVLLYSYSKTAMIAAMVLTALFFLPRINEVKAPVLMVVVVLFLLPVFLTPKTKVYHFTSIFSESTYTHDARLALQRASMRDYSEYPYGIGFGAPVFGEHSHQLINGVDSYHAIHNSYLTLLRRMGKVA